VVDPAPATLTWQAVGLVKVRPKVLFPSLESMAAAFSLEPPNQDSASSSKSDKLLADLSCICSRAERVVNTHERAGPAGTGIFPDG
jgi:hypothetical protein